MILRVLLLMALSVGSSVGISVTCPTKRYVVILFQPVTLTCNYQTSSSQPPVVTWRYKSFCQDPIQAALNPNSATNQLAQANPNYNPNIECSDSSRTVRIVASKQGPSVTLGEMYQARKVTIMNNADLSFGQTAWGDSGVYVCSVVSPQDLTGNNEDYTELIVLDWLLVVLVVLGFLLLLLLICICWCQCCPHTCCCYVRCPCCPERCCCPRALYEAGKAVKSGVPSVYAPTLYAPSMYSQPHQGTMMAPGHSIPMVPVPMVQNGYQPDYEAASSVGHGSQVPLLRDQESGANSVRSGYRVQANPADNSTRVLYYMERELANFDPTRPGNANGKYERLAGMSEVSSLHEDSNPRGILRDGMNRARNPPMAAIMDRDENMSTISSVSQQGRYRDDAGSRGGLPSRGRARSLDNLDDLGRSYYDEDHAERGGRERGRRGSDDEWSGRGYDRDDHRRRDYSPDSRRGDGGYNERRTRSRDDLANLDRGRSPAPRGRGYDDSILQEALQRKRMNEQKRAASRDRLDSGSEAPSSRSGRGERRGPDRRRHSDDEDRFPPPLPPPYSESESSKKSNLRKDGAVSRESLVV
ncbi:lipolysis-stimulated lipoprotein receptor isoform X2 [Lepisosteus oculatus]|uniref:lipolysis-stimulated lipoprotein receptor isoform X2 n=1 Tax=Lepisosteus oculatus TaxID=7918 RepID=UPI003713A125